MGDTSTIQPAVDAQPALKTLPGLSEQEQEQERLRKFRERVKSYQK
jgi:hypothetical protein